MAAKETVEQKPLLRFVGLKEIDVKDIIARAQQILLIIAQNRTIFYGPLQFN